MSKPYITTDARSHKVGDILHPVPGFMRPPFNHRWVVVEIVSDNLLMVKRYRWWNALWRWFKAQLTWTYWIGNTDKEPVMLVYDLIHSFGIQVAIHKIVKEDKLGCFHSHPAVAYRLVLWGGYFEEVWISPLKSFMRWIGPGHWGRVNPEYIHRIEFLPEGCSWSLWFRGRKTHKIKLIGNGWPPELRGRASTSGDHDFNHKEEV